MKKKVKKGKKVATKRIKKSAKKKVKRTKKNKKNMRLELKYVKIKELKKWKKNPRINDEAAEKLCGLIEEHGFLNPIIADKKSKTIYAGHTRIKSAESLGYKEVPVIFVPFDSPEAAEMFALSDNKSSEWADWDKGFLGEILSKNSKLNLEDLERASGFTQIEIEGLQPPESPEDFKGVGDDINTEHRCPKCHYEWSGKAKADGDFE